MVDLDPTPLSVASQQEHQPHVDNLQERRDEKSGEPQSERLFHKVYVGNDGPLHEVWLVTQNLAAARRLAAICDSIDVQIECGER